MNRYISIDNAIKIVTKAMECGEYKKLIDVSNALYEAPAADVVEVVRCKDCRHYHRYTDRHTNEPSHWGRCTDIHMDIDLTENDFCCYGERKQSDGSEGP